MADTQKSCVICGGEESDGELLIEAPCGRHFVCPDDVSSFFERATQNESLFPPKCCEQMFMLHKYEDYVPFDVQWAYQVKEQGEYATLAKFRVYCSAPSCNKFLHPSTHITNDQTKLTYAICEDEACLSQTCIGCKTLLDGLEGHVCQKDENEEKFKLAAKEKGYQECTVCGATVELMEACNHISCDCGHDFCYICGKAWAGLHGCPHYGPATYDEEDYNQDGYHRDTGLNREGLTRRQENMRRRGEDVDEDEDDDDGGEEDPDWEVLQHLQPEQRVMVNTLRGEDREDALDQLRIELFEQQGILFGQDPPALQQEGESDEGEGEGEGDWDPDAMPEHDNLDEEIEPDIDEDSEDGDADQDPMPDIDAPQVQGDAGAEAVNALQALLDIDQAAIGVENVYGGFIDPVETNAFAEIPHVNPNDFDYDHPVWTFEGMAKPPSDDAASDAPKLGSSPPSPSTSDEDPMDAVAPSSAPSPNPFLPHTPTLPIAAMDPSTPSPLANYLAQHRALWTVSTPAQDLGDDASDSPASGSTGPATPTGDAMDVDEVSGDGVKPPGAWPQSDDEEL